MWISQTFFQGFFSTIPGGCFGFFSTNSIMLVLVPSKTHVGMCRSFRRIHINVALIKVSMWLFRKSLYALRLHELDSFFPSTPWMILDTTMAVDLGNWVRRIKRGLKHIPNHFDTCCFFIVSNFESNLEILTGWKITNPWNHYWMHFSCLPWIMSIMFFNYRDCWCLTCWATDFASTFHLQCFRSTSNCRNMEELHCSVLGSCFCWLSRQMLHKK